MTDLGALRWRTSSRTTQGNCVEVAFGAGAVFTRDSKDRGGPMLVFPEAKWADFVAQLRLAP